MSSLVALPAWVVVLISLVAGLLVAAGARVTLRRFIPDESGLASVVGPLMPALGAVFALLSALALSNEAAELRSADQDIAAEAAASSRLAWASTTPGIESEPVQIALAAYLRSTRTNEWEGHDDDGDPATLLALSDLERAVRVQAATKDLGSAQAGELLGALDSVSSLRRERLATRAHELPTLYLVVVMASGLALVVNAAALALDRGRRVAALTGGLVVVVSLVIALLLAVTSPFQGGFISDGNPIDAVRADLQAGVFVP